jgi:hypothetical protein
MSPQCRTKRSAASGSFSSFSVISVITEVSQTAEGKSRCLRRCVESSWDYKRLCYGCPISRHPQSITQGRLLGVSMASAARPPTGPCATAASRRPSRSQNRASNFGHQSSERHCGGPGRAETQALHTGNRLRITYCRGAVPIAQRRPLPRVLRRQCRLSE